MATTEQLILKILADTKDIRSKLDKTTQNIGKVGKKTKQVADASKGTLGQMKLAWIAVGAAVFKAINIVKDFVSKAVEQRRVEAQLNTVLESTGRVAGLAANELKAMARELQGVTNFGDEAIIGAENLLLTFTKIGKDVFPEALETVLDMSVALGQDLKSSAIQLGKALNDPILGMTALRRVGVNFSKEQVEMVKGMVEAGETMKAQKFILNELNTEFGGSARAMVDVDGGATQLMNIFGDLKEQIGNVLIEGIQPFIKGIKNLITPQESLTSTTRSIISLYERYKEVTDELTLAKNQLTEQEIEQLKQEKALLEVELLENIENINNAYRELTKLVSDVRFVDITQKESLELNIKRQEKIKKILIDIITIRSDQIKREKEIGIEVENNILKLDKNSQLLKLINQAQAEGILLFSHWTSEISDISEIGNELKDTIKIQADLQTKLNTLTTDYGNGVANIVTLLKDNEKSYFILNLLEEDLKNEVLKRLEIEGDIGEELRKQIEEEEKINETISKRRRGPGLIFNPFADIERQRAEAREAFLNTGADISTGFVNAITSGDGTTAVKSITGGLKGILSKAGWWGQIAAAGIGIFEKVFDEGIFTFFENIGRGLIELVEKVGDKISTFTADLLEASEKGITIWELRAERSTETLENEIAIEKELKRQQEILRELNEEREKNQAIVDAILLTVKRFNQQVQLGNKTLEEQIKFYKQILIEIKETSASEDEIFSIQLSLNNLINQYNQQLGQTNQLLEKQVVTWNKIISAINSLNVFDIIKFLDELGITFEQFGFFPEAGLKELERFIRLINDESIEGLELRLELLKEILNTLDETAGNLGDRVEIENEILSVQEQLNNLREEETEIFEEQVDLTDTIKKNQLDALNALRGFVAEFLGLKDVPQFMIDPLLDQLDLAKLGLEVGGLNEKLALANLDFTNLLPPVEIDNIPSVAGFDTLNSLIEALQSPSTNLTENNINVGDVTSITNGGDGDESLAMDMIGVFRKWGFEI